MASLRPPALVSLLRPALHNPTRPPLRTCTRTHTRTFTYHPTPRPRLPHLRSALSPSSPPRPTHTPPRRLISARTKAYLWRESLIAARIVTYGYTFLFLSALAATAAALISSEHSHPTAASLPWRTRTALALARAVSTWTDHAAATTAVLRSALEELELRPQEDVAWGRARAETLRQLAELQEAAGDVAGARADWGRVLDTVRAGAEARVGAALRVAKIAEFEGEDGAAEEALGKAVEVASGEEEEEGNSKVLLRALTEMAVFRARHGEEGRALELLTRVLAARRAARKPLDPGAPQAAEMAGDPCAEAATMTYIGEVLFALGERRQGVAWSKEAFGKSVGLAELRRRCRECAIVAGTNLSAMIALIEQEDEGRVKKRGRFSSLFAKKTEEVDTAEESAEDWKEAVRKLEQIRVSKAL